MALPGRCSNGKMIVGIVEMVVYPRIRCALSWGSRIVGPILCGRSRYATFIHAAFAVSRRFFRDSPNVVDCYAATAIGRLNHWGITEGVRSSSPS